VFPLSITPFEVLGARFADRIGKGIRGAPRDALVADVTPREIRGAAFGLRQALDTVGAFLGPLFAIALMYMLAGDMRAVFWWAVVPGAIAVLLVVVGLEEPRNVGAGQPKKAPIAWGDVGRFSAAYWGVVAVGVMFTMARFSEAFLVLKAHDTGLAVALVPLVMVVMNVVYAAVSTPAGRLSDSMDRRLVLGAGLVVLITADIILAMSDTVAGTFVGVALWGLHMGLSQGLLAALVADTAPENLRGTAFGVFNLASGIAMLAASALAGMLWSAYGSQYTFVTGALFATVSLVGLLIVTKASKGRIA
jgi:MFS family permease